MADCFGHEAGTLDDEAWERLRRDGLAAFEQDDLPRARRQLGEALALARKQFSTGDPRLAACLAALARLLRDHDPPRAAALFEEALDHWAQAEGWLARQPGIERRARSSTFHFRLESKHPGAYHERRALDMRFLLARGRTIIERLRDDDSVRDRGDRASGSFAFDSPGKIQAALDLLQQLRRS